MDDRIGAALLDGSSEKARVGDIPDLESEVRVGECAAEVFTAPGRQVIKTDDNMSEPEQLVGGVTADEPGGASQEDFGHDRQDLGCACAKSNTGLIANTGDAVKPSNITGRQRAKTGTRWTLAAFNQDAVDRSWR